MRAATSPRDLYAWHRASLAGLAPQITSEPRCGWFKRRLVKGGPWVPARIFMDQPTDPETGELVGDEAMRCEVGGRRVDPVEAWLWLADHPISESEYRYLMSLSSWASSHALDHPAANPDEKIDFRKAPIPF